MPIADRKINVRMAADSTMLRMVNLLMALSFGVHREQLEHRIGLTWPRPFLLRPLRSGQYIAVENIDRRLPRGIDRVTKGYAYLDARFLTIFAFLKKIKKKESVQFFCQEFHIGQVECGLTLLCCWLAEKIGCLESRCPKKSMDLAGGQTLIVMVG
jgi:hypothetical protein